jgi:hypothetical protein
MKSAMNRVIRKLAKSSSVSAAEAADQIDKFVHDLRRKLKRGQVASVPGVGKLSPGPLPQIMEELNGDRKSARARRRGR